MKNKFLLLALVGQLAIIGCTDDDDSGNPGTPSVSTKQKITGNWNGVQESWHYYLNGVKQNQATQTFDITDKVFSFNTNDSLYITNNGVLEDTDHWEILNDSTISINSFSGEINLLSNTEFKYLYKITAINGNDTIVLHDIFELNK